MCVSLHKWALLCLFEHIQVEQSKFEKPEIEPIRYPKKLNQIRTLPGILGGGLYYLDIGLRVINKDEDFYATALTSSAQAQWKYLTY